MSKKHLKNLVNPSAARKPISTNGNHDVPGPLTFDWRTADLDTLPLELRTYATALDELLARVNDYVLIKGEEIVGTYSNRELAVIEAIDRFGAEPVLIKQIVASEPIIEIGHVIF